MAKTRLDSTKYIARSLGAEGNTTQLAAALDALYAAIQEWNLRRDWRFLLMDTAEGFTVTGATNVSGTVTTTVTDGFAGVNLGQTFTVTDGSPAGTYTVSGITSTTVLTVTGGGGNFTTESLTFSGDIPLVAGSDTYNLPTPFKRPYIARIITGSERSLEWKDQKVLDKMFQNQTPQSLPAFYNLFNRTTFSQTRQNGKVRLFPIPSTAETLRVRFYRPIAEPSVDGTFLDVPDRYVYALLETARWHYLKNHDAETARLAMTDQKAEQMFQRCAADDEGESDDRDIGFVSQMDHQMQHQIITDEIAGWP
jgi:hypothetical protein